MVPTQCCNIAHALTYLQNHPHRFYQRNGDGVCSLIFTVNASSDEIYTEMVYKLCTNADLRRINAWINENLILALPTLPYESRWVKIRIATDMLNKLVYENVITKELNIELHDNFVKNLEDLAIDYTMASLPFLTLHGNCSSILHRVQTAGDCYVSETLITTISRKTVE